MFTRTTINCFAATLVAGLVIAATTAMGALGHAVANIQIVA